MLKKIKNIENLIFGNLKNLKNYIGETRDCHKYKIFFKLNDNMAQLTQILT